MTGALALLISVLALEGSSGGLDLVLRAEHAPTSKQLGRSVAILKTRAQLLGGSGIDVKSRGTDTIVVHIGDISNPGRARALLTSRGQLSFYDFEAHVSGRPKRKPPKAGVALRCGGGASFCPGVAGSPVKGWFFYAARGRPELTGTDLVRSQTRADADPTTG
jgi:preprotein translocase subunit SecD